VTALAELPERRSWISTASAPRASPGNKVVNALTFSACVVTGNSQLACTGIDTKKLEIMSSNEHKYMLCLVFIISFRKKYFLKLLDFATQSYCYGK
jgi:hypothetical protein